VRERKEPLRVTRDERQTERERERGGERERERERERTSALTYGTPYGRGVEMGGLRLRHRADGAQGVVQLGGGGNSVPGESAVFVVTATTASAAAAATTATVSTGTAAAAATAAVSTGTAAAAAAAAAAAVSSAVRPATGRTAATATTPEFAEELVLVLDAPFTRPQLQHRTRRNLKSKFAGGFGEGGLPRTSAPRLTWMLRSSLPRFGPATVARVESYAEIRGETLLPLD